MTEKPKPNAAAKLTYAGCALLILGTIFALNGLWPMGRLSAREPGFDRVENLVPLALLLLLIWAAFYQAQPKDPLFAFAILTTLWYCFSFLLC